MLIEGTDRIAIGNKFQSLGPIIEKALSPKWTLYARGTTALYPSYHDVMVFHTMHRIKECVVWLLRLKFSHIYLDLNLEIFFFSISEC